MIAGRTAAAMPPSRHGVGSEGAEERATRENVRGEGSLMPGGTRAGI